MILLFTTSECSISGVCRDWLPELRERWGDELMEIVDLEPPDGATLTPALMGRLGDAFGACINAGHDPTSQPWTLNEETGEVDWRGDE